MNRLPECNMNRLPKNYQRKIEPNLSPCHTGPCIQSVQTVPGKHTHQILIFQTSFLPKPLELLGRNLEHCLLSPRHRSIRTFTNSLLKNRSQHASDPDAQSPDSQCIQTLTILACHNDTPSLRLPARRDTSPSTIAVTISFKNKLQRRGISIVQVQGFEVWVGGEFERKNRYVDAIANV